MIKGPHHYDKSYNPKDEIHCRKTLGMLPNFSYRWTNVNIRKNN